MATRGTAITLTDYAYGQLRNEILCGAVLPGSSLPLAQLSKRLEVSMSVVREALTRLSEQGLVMASPNQGFAVMPLSREDLVDLTDLRIDLECRALERSMSNGDVRWEGQVVATHHVLERIPVPTLRGGKVSEDWISAHADFHDALYAACDSKRLIALVRSMRDSAEIYRHWSGRFAIEEKRDIAGEHRQLMELALDRRADDVRQALADHLGRTTEILLAHEAQIVGG
jgi:DNA-binding GntR family transcriptional regulator